MGALKRGSADLAVIVFIHLRKMSRDMPDAGSEERLSPTYINDAHAVSEAEALSYYAGLHSEPALLYCTGKKWFPPRAPEAQRRFKELRQVLNHPITEVWNKDLGWRVVKVMDAHTVS